MIRIESKDFDRLKELEITQSCEFQGKTVFCMNYNPYSDEGCMGCGLKDYYTDDPDHCPLENECTGKIYKEL